VLLGNDMRLGDYYWALWMADIQVSTATHESLDVSTLEAMYTGNCCILPRLGSSGLRPGHRRGPHRPGHDPAVRQIAPLTPSAWSFSAGQPGHVSACQPGTGSPIDR
jgi:hypothetical protein